MEEIKPEQKYVNQVKGEIDTFVSQLYDWLDDKEDQSFENWLVHVSTNKKSYDTILPKELREDLVISWMKPFRTGLSRPYSFTDLAFHGCVGGTRFAHYFTPRKGVFLRYERDEEKIISPHKSLCSIIKIGELEKEIREGLTDHFSHRKNSSEKVKEEHKNLIESNMRYFLDYVNSEHEYKRILEKCLEYEREGGK